MYMHYKSFLIVLGLKKSLQRRKINVMPKWVKYEIKAIREPKNTFWYIPYLAMKLKIFEQMKLPLSKVLFSRIKGYGCVNFLKNMIVVLLPVIWKDCCS